MSKKNEDTESDNDNKLSPEEEKHMRLLEENPWYFRYINFSDKELNELAKRGSVVLLLLKQRGVELPQEVIDEAIKNNIWLAYSFADKLSETQILNIIKDGRPSIIMHMKDPSETLWKAAIEQDPYMLTNFQDEYISDEWKEYAKKIDPTIISEFEDINDLTEEQQLMIVEKYPYKFDRLNNPTQETIWKMLKVNPKVIIEIENPTKDMIDYAISVGAIEKDMNLTSHTD